MNSSEQSDLSNADHSNTAAEQFAISNSWGLCVVAQVALLAVAGWAYWPTLLNIVSSWISNPDYSHGVLVIPIALAFLWSRRDKCPVAGLVISPSGLLLLLVAGLLRFCAARFYLPNLDGWSLPLWLAGIVLIFHGRRRLYWMLPSLAFLWFATPLPGTIEILLSTPLQYLAAQLSGWTLRVIGQPAIAEGTTVLLGEHVLDIERACSGLRMFYGILAMAFSCVVLLRLGSWHAAAVLLATMPIALIANVCRIVVTGLLLQTFSSEAASKFSHDFAGILMIPLAVVLFVVFAFWLRATAKRFAGNVPGRGVGWLMSWALAALVSTVGLWGWGQYQSQNLLGVLRVAALRYEQNEQWSLAASYLQRYLKIDDSDQGVREKHAELYHRSAETRRKKLRSVSLLRSAWTQNPKRVDLARQAAQSAFEVDEYAASMQICEQLFESNIDEPQRSQLRLLYADAMTNLLLRRGQANADYTWEDLAAALEVASQVANAKINYSVDLARLWREKLLKPDQATRERKALGIINQLVLEHPSNPLVWLARHRYLLDFGIPGDANALTNTQSSDIDRAIELVEAADKKSQTDIYTAAAEQAKRAGEVNQAEIFLAQAIKASPKRARPYIVLAELKRSVGTPIARHDAIEVLNSALDEIGNEETALLLPLASLQADVRDWVAVNSSVGLVETQLDRLSERRRSKVLLGLGLIRARLRWETEGAYSAIQHLEKIITDESVRVHRQLSPRLFSQANLLLGRLYGSTRMLDRASEQYRFALQLDPNSRSTRIEAIAPVLNSGDLESTELMCRTLLREDPNCQEALLAMIRLHVRREIRKPLNSRNWKPAEHAYELARDRKVALASLFLARVELLEAQGQADEAQELLKDALELTPGEAMLWRESALLLERSGELELALESAQRLAELQPEEVEPQVMQATLLEKMNRSEAAEKLLSTFLERTSGRRWVQGALELAKLKLLMGEIHEANQLLEQVHAKDPANLRAISTLASVAWATGERSSLEKYESWLLDVEGAAGTLWRFYRAQRLLDEAISTEDSKYREVSRLCQQLQDVRPKWSKTSTLLGNMALRAGNTDGAILAFRRAWNLGDRSALLADRLIELLTAQGRESEAQAYVLQVRNALSLSSQLFDRAIPYFVNEDKEAALQLAEAWVSRQPEDIGAQLRLGRVLLSMSATNDEQRAAYQERALAVFFRALELGPEDIGVWLANLSCHRQVSSVEESEADVLVGLANRLELGNRARDYVFAGIYEELDKPLAARECYRRAIKSFSDDDPAEIAPVLESAAAFYSNRIAPLGEKFARETLSHDQSSEVARRVLIQLASETDDLGSISEALNFSESLPDNAAPELVDAFRRTRAILLAKRGEPADSENAIRLLESLLQKTSDDKLLVGALLERIGRIGPAFEVLSELCSHQAARPQDHAAFIRFWQDQFLKQSAPSESPAFDFIAKSAYDRLLGLPSQQAEWLRWKIREERIVGPGKNIEWGAVQDALEVAVGVNQNFGTWHPSVKLAWSRSLMQTMLRQGLPDFAVRFASQPLEGLDNANLSIALCHALILERQTATKNPGVSEFIAQQLKRSAQRPNLARAVGDYRYMLGLYEDANEAYQQALAIEPHSKLTANNLSLSLAEMPGGASVARELLTATLEEQGRDPILLDTMAVTLLIEERADEALSLLTEVLAASPDNSVALLHSAMAYEMCGQFELMQDSFEGALLLGLNESLLSQRDRDFYHRYYLDGMLSYPTEATEDFDSGELVQPTSADTFGNTRLR